MHKLSGRMYEQLPVGLGATVVGVIGARVCDPGETYGLPGAPMHISEPTSPSILLQPAFTTCFYLAIICLYRYTVLTGFHAWSCGTEILFD
jgi:hypothetical protein